MFGAQNGQEALSHQASESRLADVEDLVFELQIEAVDEREAAPAEDTRSLSL